MLASALGTSKLTVQNEPIHIIYFIARTKRFLKLSDEIDRQKTYDFIIQGNTSLSYDLFVNVFIYS